MTDGSPRATFPGQEPQPSLRVTLALGALAIVVLLVFLAVRLLVAGDRTEMALDSAAAGGEGIAVGVIGSSAGGLETGDVVVAIDGRSVSELLTGATTSPMAPGDPHRYTVVRGGTTLELAVAFARMSPIDAIGADLAFYAFLFYLFGAGIVAFALRPYLLTARLFLCLGAAIAAAEVIWAMSFAASDLLAGWIVPLFTVCNTLLFFLALSFGLHFVLAFPSVHPAVARRPVPFLAAAYGGPWLLYVIAMVAALLLGSSADPVALLLRHWQSTSYVAGVVFVAVIVCVVAQLRRHESSAERRQLLWVVWGVAVAYLPWIAALLVTLVTPMSLRGAVSWAALFFLAIPTSVAIAIVRERMFDIDLIVNRTLLYGSLTAVLAGVYAAAVSLTQRTIIALTGQQSDLSIVVATLVVVVAFTPAKDVLQRAVDRRFKGSPASVVRLQAFGDQVRARIAAVEPAQVTRRLLEEAVDALELTGGAAFLEPDRSAPACTAGAWPAEVALVVPLEPAGGTEMGSLQLGKRRDGARVAPAEEAACREVARIVAAAIAADTAWSAKEAPA